MPFSTELNWGVEDFVVMGIMLVTVGIAFRVAWRLLQHPAKRFWGGAAIIIAFLLIWAELAVGLVESFFTAF